MKPIFYTLVFLLFASCGPDKTNQPQPVSSKLSGRERLDSMKRSLQDLRHRIEEEHPGTDDQEAKELVYMHASNDPEGERIVERTPFPAAKKKSAATKGSTLYYFTGTKKIAVEITPWKDRRRSVICYDRKGNVTYRFEDVQLSYSETTEVLSFYPNGAAKVIEQRSNPGGSRYMPKTTYMFDEENHPLRSEYDDDAGQLRMPSEYTKQWDRATRSWK